MHISPLTMLAVLLYIKKHLKMLVPFLMSDVTVSNSPISSRIKCLLLTTTLWLQHLAFSREKENVMRTESHKERFLVTRTTVKTITRAEMTLFFYGDELPRKICRQKDTKMMNSLFQNRLFRYHVFNKEVMCKTERTQEQEL